LRFRRRSFAVRLSPNYVDAFVSRGTAWAQKGEDDKAIADFDEVLRLQPNNTLALTGRGSSLGRKGVYTRP
jgi:Flp pilus assembly protein TadD